MSGLSTAAAKLAGNFGETLLYGMYLVTCCFCARTLFLTGSGQEERWICLEEVRWVMTIVASIFFILCTFDVVIGLVHDFQGFVARDVVVDFWLGDSWIDWTRFVNQILAMLLSDFVLIYRCWIVYGRRSLVILPSLIKFFGVVVAAIEMGRNLSATRRAPHPGVPWGTAMFGVTTLQNIFTTGILIWRIWQVDSQSEKYLDRSALYQPNHLRKVIRVIAESGVVYTLMTLACTISSATGSNVMYPFADMTLQAAGIVFNVIIFRCSARRDKEFSEFRRSTQGSIRFFREQSSVKSRCSGESGDPRNETM